MKHLFAGVWLCFAASILPSEVQSAELIWLTDFSKARTQANAEKKSVLLFFHGSDWCPTCLLLQRQFIESAQFIDYARQRLVLVDVDFPERTQQSDALKQANAALKAKFNIGDNLPTLVLLNEAGETVFQESGYTDGGAAELLRSLQRHAKPASAAKQTGYKDVNVAEFAKLAADKQNVVLDVRTAREFQDGHLPAAINLDVNAPDFARRVGALDKSKTYLVHCASGVRSVRACGQLDQLGFSNLFNLTGGYRAWVNAGQPVTK